MEHIIATTDLSANSRAGMRFAIQLARQRKARLTFLHVHFVLKASTWTEGEYHHFHQELSAIAMTDLRLLVNEVCRSLQAKSEDYELALYEDIDVARGIMHYAKHHRATYLCASTHGASQLRRLLGTTTGRLITHSPIPVITVPSAYRMKPLRALLYASDLTDTRRELSQVVSFARPLELPIELVHLHIPGLQLPEPRLTEEVLKAGCHYSAIKVTYKDWGLERSLVVELSALIGLKKPSLLVLFTDQHRSFFQKLLLSSKAREFGFALHIPMLTFPKIGAQEAASTAKSPSAIREGDPSEAVAQTL